VVEPNETLAAFNAAGIDVQIATAHRYPRSVAKFLREGEDLVSANREVAAMCTYALPRGGKSIQGPSVRLAEMLASTWGNLRVSSMVTGDDGKFIIAQAICLDLQTNVGISVEARRRITDRHGRRYDDDMIGVASNAAISIALRNAIFRVIPRTYVDIIHDAAKQVAAGDLEDFDSTRAAWVAAMVGPGKIPTERQLFAALGVEGIQDIGTDEIIIMQGWQTSIRDGGLTYAEIVAPPEPDAGKATPTPANGTKSAKLAAKLADSSPPEPGSNG
jgi:hypothetical protein